MSRRRQFSGGEKRRILSAADNCTEPGEIGALLRREGLYSSSLAKWRRQRDGAVASSLDVRQRGRKVDAVAAEARQIAQLRRDNSVLQRRLDQAHEIIAVQKKLCTLLGLPVTADVEETS